MTYAKDLKAAHSKSVQITLILTPIKTLNLIQMTNSQKQMMMTNSLLTQMKKRKVTQRIKLRMLINKKMDRTALTTKIPQHKTVTMRQY